MSDVAQIIDDINRDFLSPPGKQPIVFVVNNAGDVSAIATTVIVDTTMLSPEEDDLLAAGRHLEIGSEIVRITAISGTTPAFTLTIAREKMGTDGAIHTDGSDIFLLDDLYVSRLSIFNAVADAIETLWPDLWTVGTEESTSGVSPIELPAYAGEVLDVLVSDGAGRWIQTGSWDEIQDFPYVSTGRAVQLRGVSSGSVIIQYKKIPQRPTLEADLLADLYVSTGWVKIIAIGAVAQLVAGFDLSLFDTEYITQMLRSEGQEPGEGKDIRDSLLQLRQFLILPFQRQQIRTQHDRVVIDQSY